MKHLQSIMLESMVVVQEGEGTLFYANGDIYSGHWHQEKKKGDGQYMYSAGTQYIIRLKVCTVNIFRFK